MFDLLIRDALVLDGMGEDAYPASIGVRDGKIEAVGALTDARAGEVIDAAGLYAAPGFIDTHSHSDIVLLFEHRGVNMLSQGITTQIAGNCGDSIAPLTDAALADMKSFLPAETYEEISKLKRDPGSMTEHLEKIALGVNVALMAGHGTLRYAVMGYDDRPPTAREMDAMKALLAEAMEAGAFGLTSGLIYPPGVYAGEEELTELCKTAAARGGVYASHMRNESDYVEDSVAETIRVAERAGLPAVVSHHKIAGRKNWGKSRATLAQIDEANRRGLKVRLDQYPYQAGATNLLSALPPVFAANGQLEYVKKLRDRGIRREIRAQLARDDAGFDNLIRSCGYGGALVLAAPMTPNARGKTIEEIATERGAEPDEVVFDLLVENDGSVPSAFFSMGEEDIRRIMRSPYAMGGTDSYFVNDYVSTDHPRFMGSFIKILAEYARDKKALSLPEAVRKLTSLPADMFGLASKGRLAAGFDADIVLFDYGRLCATSDFVRPLAPNEGVKYVLVRGTIALKDDAVTGARAGKLLKRR